MLGGVLQMKIEYARIRNKKIYVNTVDRFHATYKNREIYINTDHGFGEADHPGLRRFYIEVVKSESGMYDYDGCIDLPNMHAAIKEALEGSCLMPNAT